MLKFLLIIAIAVGAFLLLLVLMMTFRTVFRKLVSIIFILVGMGVAFWLAWQYVPEVRPPGDSIIAFVQGKWAEWRGAPATAENFYKQSAAHFPSKVFVYETLGDLARRNKEYDKATGYYNQAMEAASNAPNIRVKLAELQWERGNEDIALSLYKEAIATDPKNTKLHMAIGNLYYNRARKLGSVMDYHEAAKIFQKVFDEKPNDLDLGYKLAEAYYAEKKYEKSLNIYCGLAVKNPDNAPLAYFLSTNLDQLGAQKEAAKVMQYAAELVSEEDPAESQIWAQQALGLNNGSANQLPVITKCMTQWEAATQTAAVSNTTKPPAHKTNDAIDYQ